MSEIIEHIRNDIIGDKDPVHTPYGVKPMVYADYTASGRALRSIERRIVSDVLPSYANTHTEASYTGARTTALREQARSVIHAAVGGSEQDKVIFCGSGATGAINRLIACMGLQGGDACDGKRTDAPVVFIGPYEHHSNELPWRESVAEVVVIPADASGMIDQNALAGALEQHADRCLKIGSFSAASNVTGIKSDVEGITALLKQHNALAFWDYAAAAPYVTISMNGPAPLDAVFISTHKFIGGPATPGVLVVKEALLSNAVPAVVGGGTVAYVSPDSHHYVADVERREEGGTPAIIESIRAGMVFALKEQVGVKTIEERESQFIARALSRLDEHPSIEILGSTERQRLAILSLRIKHRGKDLHYGFVVALLNDLFGIQARGGCSCAGPYGHQLLSIDASASERIAQRVLAGDFAQRPGWVRLSFNYFIDDAEFDYLLSAIELIAEHGWRLLPDYNYCTHTGVWRHDDAVGQPSISELFTPEFAQTDAAPATQAEHWQPQHLLQQARDILLCASATGAGPVSLSESSNAEPSVPVSHADWFLTAQDVQTAQGR
ncbi:aminotransferase class V-fold PLP-dependent enzyme [Halioglobus pacificus]|uniref:Aminotransferase n=1 Tax=Parahalioglobus pacificus TaxID=930806 RepID=A0A918XE80_9GAMM|nr:aminotransferase class V-fold PLP-dependent enzyme [Halioglobus pacificus]GHD26756.1 aminotransferase [Halioglobus pacificus]